MIVRKVFRKLLSTAPAINAPRPAIAQVVVEIRTRHGLADADDLGIEKLPFMAR